MGGKKRPTKEQRAESYRRHGRGWHMAKYGLTVREYEELLAKQKGVCAICGDPPGRKRLAVDHDHQTGKVRGLLCTRCNPALGYLRDSPERLANALRYLPGGLSEFRKPCIYLAGAIRDEKPEDYLWREKVIDSLKGKAYFLNPLGGKQLDQKTGQWSMNGISPGPKVIVKHDFWCVDKSDILLFNFTALMEKYPNIGTLVEFGRATSTGALLYSVIDPDYTGHSNLGMFRLHPFIEQNSAATFETVDSMIAFLDGHLDVLSGKNPHYLGTAAKGFAAANS